MFDAGGLFEGDLALRSSRSVLAINYHATPPSDAPRLDQHFRFYRDHFECLGEDDLLRFLAGVLRLRRPGVVLCFDDGQRDNAEVAAPLLEQYGLRGWFMLPGGFLNEPEPAQPAYYRRNIRPGFDGAAPVFAMTWASARALAGNGHAIGCHTWSHRTLGSPTSIHVTQEVALAREKLEQRLGSSVRTFCWARGRVEDHSAAAHAEVVRRYELAFTSMGRAVVPGDDPRVIHRFNVESGFELAVVRLRTSRIAEAVFARRRRAVRRRLLTEIG